MSQINPRWRNLTERLITFETKENMPSGTKIPGACLASDKLRPHLVSLMGSIGYRALLARALGLAKAEFAWLQGVQIKTDASCEGFEELEAHVDPDEFSEGSVVLLSHLLGLLVAFIGEELTLRLVRQAWPKLSSYNFDHDEGGT